MDYDSRNLRIFNQERLGRRLVGGLESLVRDDVVSRIWSRDHTVWKPDDVEITDRLGWLDAPSTAENDVPAAEAFAAGLREEGLARAVVLGMGGSSLAPDVFGRLFPGKEGYPSLEVLDSTEPGTVRDLAAGLDLERTLFLVSSKSGTTAESVALFSYFYDLARRAVGQDRAGRLFAAVTDPGTPLAALAARLGFRATFHGRPDVGGRFSALTPFGLVPAAVKGIDLPRLLAAGRAAADDCRIGDPALNPGALLGCLLGTAAGEGMDKLTLFMPPELAPLAAWLEQLIAESTGKEGRGIVPVPEGSPGPPEAYGKDRLFVRVSNGGAELGPDLTALIAAGAPLAGIELPDAYGLGGHFFLWEFATAVAGHLMGINPFNQPNVESTKRRTREILAGPPAGQNSQPRPPSIGREERPGGAEDALEMLLGTAREGDYLAVLAFLPTRPAVAGLLDELAAKLRRRSRLPVTVGFGPRYLHSTGQLHKGDAGRGIFLLLTASSGPDVPIPAIDGLKRPAPSFGALFDAQGRGDEKALADKGRRVLRLEIEGSVEAGLGGLLALLE